MRIIGYRKGRPVYEIAGGTNTFGITAWAYRWYNDGTESGMVAQAAENTSYDANVGAGDRDLVLRYGVQESGTGSASGATTDDYQLQYSTNGGAAWNNVTGASSVVQAYASANLTDAGSTTQLLSSGTGSFIAGEIAEDGLIDDWQLTANNFSELVYTVRVLSSGATNDQSITFRVLRNGAVFNTYSQTPTLTVDTSKLVGGVALTITPELPAGVLNHSVLGAALTVTPTLPAGSASAAGGGGGLQTGWDEVGVFWTSVASETGAYPAGTDKVSESGVYLFSLEAAGGGQTVTGVALSATPSLPAGSLVHSLTGVALSATPSLPAGKLNHSLTGVVLTITPSQPAGSLNHSIIGVALTATPSLPAGTLNHSVLGVVVTVTPSQPAGTVSVGVNLIGVTLEITPSLPAGTVAISSVLGVALSVTPSLPAGTVAISSVLGVALTATPSLPAGKLNHGVLGVALSITPSQPAGLLNHSVLGVAITVTPTQPAGSVNKAGATVTGVELTITPTLPAGTVAITSVLGQTLTQTPSLPQGSLFKSIIGVALSVTPSLPAGKLNHSLSGVVLVVTPSLPPGSAAFAQQVIGVVLVVTPSQPQGSLAQGALGGPVPDPKAVWIVDSGKAKDTASTGKALDTALVGKAKELVEP